MILLDQTAEVGEMALLPNSMGIEARAELFARPRSIEEAEAFLAEMQGEVPRMLGGGTNLLLSRPVVPGVVMSLGALRRIRVAGQRVTAGAGTQLSLLIGETVARGLSGLEVLAGIPGTFGGAVIQNAGGRHGEIGDVVEAVTLLHPDGQVERRRGLQFRYRDSGLKGSVLLEATVRLTPTADPASLRARYRQILREKRASQPLSAASAGCIFKNPSADKPAARLIQEAGWKGRRVGAAVVSRVHSNFIVNEGGATGAQVLELIEQIEQDIAQRYGVRLEREVELW